MSEKLNSVAEDAGVATGLRAVIATPGLPRLFISSLVARISFPFFGIGLFVHSQHLTGSFSAAGMVTAAYAAAVGVGGPPLGRLVDRHGQTTVLLGSAGLTAVLLFVVALLPSATPLGVLIGFSALLGAITPPAAACMRTLLPELVRDDDVLRTTYAVDASANEATWVVGPPLGLAVGAIWTPGAALALAGLVLLLGAAVFSMQPASRAWRPVGKPARGAGRFQARGMSALILVFAAVGVLFGAAEVGVTAAATSSGSAAAASPLLAVWGIGGLLGGLMASRFGGGARSMPGLTLLLLALTAGHVAVGLVSHNLMLVGVVLVIAGATIAPAYATIYAMVEHTAPEASLTEAFAWLATAGAVGGSMGAAAAGVIADDFGSAFVFLVAGIAGLVAVAVTLTNSCSLGTALRPRVAATPIDAAVCSVAT